MSAKKKRVRKPDPASKRSQGIDRHTGRRVVFHMDPQEYALITQHISESNVELKVSAIMRRAVRMYLESVGKWPPPDPDGKPRK